MITSFPDQLDPSQVVGAPMAAVQKRLGITGSTDPDSVSYQLSRVIPSLSHRTGGTFWTHPATGDCYGSNLYSQNTLYAIPMYIPDTADYSGIGVIRVAASVGACERLGVYSDAEGVPADLIVDCGFTAPSTSGAQGFKYVTPPSVFELSAGWVWLVCVPQLGINTLFSTVGTSTGAPTVVATSEPSATGMTMGYSGTTTEGQLPAEWGSTYTECQTVPLVYLSRS